jgi:hypothetical protein
MKLRFLLPIALLAFVLASCSYYMPRYIMGLSEVERPANATEQYGPTAITRTESGYLFEDGLIRSTWTFLRTQISFSITNKTGHSIKIPWDDAAFVNSSGQSMRVIHSGVKLIDRDKPQSPSIVARNSTLTDIIIPADNIRYGTYAKDWVTDVLDRDIMIEGGDSLKAYARYQELKDKRIRVVLPLQIEGVTNEYTFTFAMMNPDEPVR